MDSDIFKRYEEFERGFFEASGISIKIYRPIQYPEFLNKLEKGEIQFATLQGLDFLVVHDQGLVDMGLVISSDYAPGPLHKIEFYANPERGFKEAQTLQSMLEQFAGKTPCWMLSWADAGYVVPAGMLAQAGKATRTLVFVPAESDLFRAIYEGRCDFGATYYSPELKPSDYGVLRDLPDIDRKVVEIYVSEGIIPPQVIAYAKNLPEPLRKKITEGFLKLVSSEPDKEILRKYLSWQSFSFEAPDESLYEPLRHYAQAAGIDLASLLAPPYMGTERSTDIVSTTAAKDPNTLVIDAPFSGENINALLPPIPTEYRFPAIYAELARMQADGSYFPYLAEKLPTLENGMARFAGQGQDRQLEVEFRLRPGLNWQDREAQTSQDLVFFLELGD